MDTGVPVRIRTDGRPQFTSSRFQQFLKKWGVTSTISTPHCPQSNGNAEAAVKAMKHLVAKTAEHGSLDCDEFSSGLIEWVNAPKAHGLSPAEILFGAPLRSIVPAKLKYFKIGKITSTSGMQLYQIYKWLQKPNTINKQNTSTH